MILTDLRLCVNGCLQGWFDTMSANIEVHQITILDTATIQDALKVLDKTGLGIVFVVDRTHALVGVATDGDIRRGFLQGATTQTPITQVMNPNFVWAKAGAQPADILTKMSEQIRHVPLLDEYGRLVDYVSFRACVRSIN